MSSNLADSRIFTHPARIVIFSIVLILCIAQRGFPNPTVLFQDDFENLQAGDTPDLFQPSGTGSPDWDNQLYNPFPAAIDFNEIDAANVGGNTTKKYHLKPNDGTGDRPLLLGANFSPSSDRFVVVEYDILTADSPANGPAGVIIYADGYGDLDGTEPNLRVALQVEFNDFNNVSDDSAGANLRIYRTVGFLNDVLNFDSQTPQNDEYALLHDGDSSIFAWALNTWYRVQVVADQDNGTFDIKFTDKSTGAEKIATNQAYNNALAGYVRKIWFYSGDRKGDIYVDNILIYESATEPQVEGPTIILQELTKGPSNANTGLDVDFHDESDLQSIQYKIGTGGTWTDLTSDGTNAFNLAGAADTAVTALVFLEDGDFNGMAQGESQIYFRATDDAAITTESAAYLSFYKDTSVPSTASVTEPNAAIISSFPSLGGIVGDAVSGVAVNSATFTLQRVG